MAHTTQQQLTELKQNLDNAVFAQSWARDIVLAHQDARTSTTPEGREAWANYQHAAATVDAASAALLAAAAQTTSATWDTPDVGEAMKVYAE